MICAVEDCPKPIRRRGPYCYAHYMKNWRHGTPTPTWGYRKNIAGQRFGQLVALGYDREASRWWCMCDCGAVVARRQGDLNKAHKAGGDSACGDDTLHRRLKGASYSG